MLYHALPCHVADGFPNMLWGWFDSADKNFPHPLDAHLVACLFSMIDPLLTTLLPATPSLWNGRENNLSFFWGCNFSRVFM
jgi:hypothetical protein